MKEKTDEWFYFNQLQNGALIPETVQTAYCLNNSPDAISDTDTHSSSGTMGMPDDLHMSSDIFFILREAGGQKIT